MNVAGQDKHHIAGMPRYRGNGVGHRPVAVRARLIDQDHTHVAACAPEPPNLPQQSEHRRAPSTILLRLPPDASLAQRRCVAACQEGIDPSLVRHWMLERQPHSHASPSNRASDSPDKRRDLGRAMDLTQQDQRSVLDRVTDRIDGRAALQCQLPRDRRLACALARRPAPRDDEGRDRAGEAIPDEHADRRSDEGDQADERDDQQNALALVRADQVVHVALRVPGLRTGRGARCARLRQPRSTRGARIASCGRGTQSGTGRACCCTSSRCRCRTAARRRLAPRWR